MILSILKIINILGFKSMYGYYNLSVQQWQCILTISFGGGLEITQFYLTPDTVLYNGPNITLLQGRSTFWTKLALLLLTKSDNSKHVTFSIYTLFINKLSFLQRMQFKQFWKKKKIFISNSPSYFDLASQHLSINVINSTCSVGETTTLQSLVHHVCKVSKLADCVQRVGEKCNKMSVILLTSQECFCDLIFS